MAHNSRRNRGGTHYSEECDVSDGQWQSNRQDRGVILLKWTGAKNKLENSPTTFHRESRGNAQRNKNEDMFRDLKAPRLGQNRRCMAGLDIFLKTKTGQRHGSIG